MSFTDIYRLLISDGWGKSLMAGMVTTLEISILAFALGTVIGLVVALCKLKGPRPLVACANAYTTLCRAIPELLLILLLYYVGTDAINLLMHALGRGTVEVNGFAAAVVVLGIVSGAYQAEVLRGAILAVSPGLMEAARAYGMARSKLLLRVTLPCMLPFAVGGLSNLWLVLVKDSALISVVGYGELLTAGRQAAASTKHYLTFYLAVAACYYLITLVSGVFFRRIEMRFERWMPGQA